MKHTATATRLAALMTALALLTAGTASAEGFYGLPQGGGSFSNPFGGGGFGENGGNGGNYDEIPRENGSPYGNTVPFGFGQPGGQGENAQVSETTLKAMPSARSVRSGEELILNYDLLLSEEDRDRISVIEQGTTLEYVLSYTELKQTEAADGTETEGTPESSDSPAETVSFSMNRANNEKCQLVLHPGVKRTSTLTVRARMIFSDGKTLECTSDRILVFTEEEIRSHLSVQACAPGDEIQADFMALGPEGLWQFTCYAAYSTDGGQTWQRSEDVLIRFQLNTHEREPNISVPVTVAAEGNCMYRIEADVTLPDGVVLVHASDPVRVGSESEMITF